VAQPVVATNQQTMEFVVTGPGNANRVFITTGMAQVSLEAFHPGGVAVGVTTQKGSFRVLINPVLTAGQFHKATATASLADVTHNAGDPAQSTFARWVIDEVEATWDDESGKIQLRIDASVQALGGADNILNAVAFQVTTLATV